MSVLLKNMYFCMKNVKSLPLEKKLTLVIFQKGQRRFILETQQKYNFFQRFVKLYIL